MDMIVFSWHVSKKDTRGSENKNYEEEALPDEHVAYHRLGIDFQIGQH